MVSKSWIREIIESMKKNESILTNFIEESKRDLSKKIITPKINRALEFYKRNFDFINNNFFDIYVLYVPYEDEKTKVEFEEIIIRRQICSKILKRVLNKDLYKQFTTLN